MSMSEIVKKSISDAAEQMQIKQTARCLHVRNVRTCPKRPFSYARYDRPKRPRDLWSRTFGHLRTLGRTYRVEIPVIAFDLASSVGGLPCLIAF
jgi:hypothetical protein